MATSTTNRRLATILVADVDGYSRLMRADEEGTLGDLRAHLAELVAPVVERFHGRIVKTVGDGLLIEFGSAVEAVRSTWCCRPTTWRACPRHCHRAPPPAGAIRTGG